MGDTPRTKAATRMAFTSEYMVEIELAQKLERELAEAKEKMINNPFCSACKEPDCCVSGDGTCALIRKYLTVDETTKQRDALANALESLAKAIISGVPYDITDLLDDLEQAIAATKGVSHE